MPFASFYLSKKDETTGEEKKLMLDMLIDYPQSVERRIVLEGYHLDKIVPDQNKCIKTTGPVWLVSVVHYDHSEVQYVCLSKETALVRFEEVRAEIIRQFNARIEDDIKGGFDPHEFVDHVQALEQWTVETTRDGTYWETPGVREMVIES